MKTLLTDAKSLKARYGLAEIFGRVSQLITLLGTQIPGHTLVFRARPAGNRGVP